MMHTAACHARSPAYRHKTNTAAPISSAAEIDTVKAITSFHRSSRNRHRAGYPPLKLRPALRRSQRARNRHLSHAPDPSADSAPHSHLRPSRHPLNMRPMLITSRHRSLAFRKTRSAKNAMPPDTIGSGNIAFPWAAPAHSSGNGAARFIQLSSWPSSGPARAVSSPARAGCLVW